MPEDVLEEACPVSIDHHGGHLCDAIGRLVANGLAANIRRAPRSADFSLRNYLERHKSTLDGMIARRFGRIINITSISVKAPFSYLGLSNGARSGLTGFVAGVARDVACHNVTINNLLPGSFSTAHLRRQAAAAVKPGQSADEVLEEWRAGESSGRLGDPGELGMVCAFLCGANAGYITRQNIFLDGGTYPGTF
jgi:3-oxoacyl-[acyl-carrier protein] reductase